MSEKELESRVRAVLSDPDAIVLVELSGESTTARRCPTCQAVMGDAKIADVEIERCLEGHGIWFDNDELGRVLSGAIDGHGVWGELRKSSSGSALPGSAELELLELIASGVALLLD